MESKNENKQAKQKQTQKEHFDICQIGGELAGLVKKGEMIKNYKLI